MSFSNAVRPAYGHEIMLHPSGWKGCSTLAGIFINYRSSDDDFAAPVVDMKLCEIFGADHVFRDSRSLSAGTDYPPELWDRLRLSQIFLVLIGKRWLTLTDKAGERRLDDPNDFVRQEIRVALRQGTRIIPVLLNGAMQPDPADLPEDIRGLHTRQFVKLRVRESDIDLDHLVKEISSTIAVRTDRREPVANPDGTSYYQAGNNFYNNVGTILNGTTNVSGDVVGGNKGGNGQ
jgi:hypothetical protein